MDLDELTDRVRERFAGAQNLNASVKFAFADEGVIFVDATQAPPAVSNDDAPADCTISMSMDDFLGMTRGELDPTTAFMMGKLKVEGDMSVAMKLQSVLG